MCLYGLNNADGLLAAHIDADGLLAAHIDADGLLAAHIDADFHSLLFTCRPLDVLVIHFKYLIQGVTADPRP